MSEQAQRPAEGLQAELPHLCVLLLWYPLFTQPFIFRDVEALRKRIPTQVVTLYGKNFKHCSDEMVAAAKGVRMLGVRALPAILLSFARVACTKPLLLAKAFAKTLFFRWKSLETFGENLWAFFCGVHLAREMEEGGFDMLYAPWPRGTTTAARTIKLLTGIPYVTSARGDNLNPPDPDLVPKLREALCIRTNNAADSMRIDALTQGAVNGRIHLVYNSLTLKLDAPAPVPMQSPVKILAVGRFDVTKGFDVLMQACGILKSRGRDFRLTLAGGGGTAMGLGHMTDTILKLRKNLGLEEIVSLPGIVSHDALPELLQGHDIFAAPCVVHESGRRDGIPNTVIEALSFGLPVVASKVNALPEVVRHKETGLLVEQKNPEALADAICWFMDNPEEARALGRAGAKLAADMFCAQKNGDRLAKLFADALQTRR